MSLRARSLCERRRYPGALVIGMAMIGLVAGCASTDRPSIEEWGNRWQQKRALVPTVEAMAEGGRSYCDRLVAELRVQLDELEPTPRESIDPALDSWIAHFRTLAFECPTDPARIRADIEVINELAAEIETALGEP